jgi:hypothetical protein
MTRKQVIKWTVLLLVGPAAGVTGAVLYEHDINRDDAGLLAGIGWITAAVVTTWFVVKVFRALPVRYSHWAMLAAIPVALVSAGLHALVFALTGAEEPFFFIIAIFGAPLLFVGGFFGTVIPRGPRAPRGRTLQPG